MVGGGSLAVEEMRVINTVGFIDDIDSVSDEMVKCGCIHVINAIDDIKRQNIPNEDDILRAYKSGAGYLSLRDKIKKILEIAGMDSIVHGKYMDEIVDTGKIEEAVGPLYDEFTGNHEIMEKTQESLNQIYELKANVENIRGLKFAISELKNLKFFNFSMGRLSSDYYSKLKENIENIPSIIFEVQSSKDFTVIVSFTPRFMDDDAAEILKSLGYEEISIPDRVKGVPENVIEGFELLIKEKLQEIEKAGQNIECLKKQNEQLIRRCFSLMEKYSRSQDINNGAVCTDRAFYMCGWIPKSNTEGISKKLEKLEDSAVIVFGEQDQIKDVLPPTHLRNNVLVKPFEYLVNMYGIPSYFEKDPTAFVAVSYMIMFGVMFGDVGQGFVLFLGGLYLLLVKKSPDFGGILTRVGVSSMVFGCLYGSLFGNENIIPPILFHPLDNINTVLIGGVILGIILSTVGYFYNFRNCIKTHETEEGLFGREGAAGFLFYWLLLLTAFTMFINGRPLLPISVTLGLLIILLLLIVLKQPLSRLIEGKRPLHHDRIGDYYIESIFGVIETLLSMLSKTISFIRLGAFALNHVGLFIAFATIANMINNSVGGFVVLLIGNIVIIGLEGLVVFIQGLRLEYYELFSRFYKGDGSEYKPVRINYAEDAEVKR